MVLPKEVRNVWQWLTGANQSTTDIGALKALLVGCGLFGGQMNPKCDLCRAVEKDKDRRELPLVDKVAQLLVDIQTGLPEGQPYLLLPPQCYQYLMKLKTKGELKYEVCKCPDGNFDRSWRTIFKKAGTEDGTFHDLRSTCITEWLEKGLLPHEVKKLAGHADINTTMNYYVGIRESLIDRARGASSTALGKNFNALFARAAQNGKNDKKPAMSGKSQGRVFAGVIEARGTKA